MRLLPAWNGGMLEYWKKWQQFAVRLNKGQDQT
jgi:hypothetical protein